MEELELKLFATDIRETLIKALACKGGGHIGGALSICDLLAVLYGDIMRYRADEPEWDNRDYLVCSKGHAAPAIYATLALKGFFPMEWLEQLNRGGTNLPGHSDRLKVPGIDATTGSLGQGFSIACGLAHGAKLKGRDSIVYCITGDGENDEGQIWEAAMYAANYRLDNLIGFVDWNKKQIDGTNDEVMQLGDLCKKYEAFGWRSRRIAGDNVQEIKESIEWAIHNRENRPTMFLLDTVKGAGIPCIEAMESNHCIGVPQHLAKQCLEELQGYRNSLKEGV